MEDRIEKLNIPDIRFRKAIIDILFPDRKTQDYYDLTTNDLKKIEKVKKLNISNREISNLEGIHYFKSLLILECYSNNIKKIDLQNNKNLLKLYCGNNKIEELKLNGNLKSLSCPDNELKYLNLLSEKYLQYIYCDNNKIERLDLYKMVELNKLKCAHNRLKTINLTYLPTLTHLECNDNELESLNVENNVFLVVLYAYNNRLKNMDISGNPFMDRFDIRGNEISYLNLSENLDLTRLYCSENKIASLYIRDNKSLVTGYVSLDDQEREASLEKGENCYYIDMKKLVGDTNIRYLKEFSEGEYDKNTGIVKFYRRPKEVNYIFYTWNIARTRMNVKLKID